ncbi:FAD-dependent monooxygenase [Kitasatospora terrestris]|uniref:FAD-dependent monooxygenase n=1 Tax=Kitasatospora terrestris TaxID=258051 RepID=A0ABP9E2Q6_9ACTN
MAHTSATDVLVTGAGPVGLSAAAELRRRGIRCRLIDRLPARLPYAKAVGIQPRTMEVWDRMGLATAALEAAVPLRGQLLYLNGREQARIDLALPPEVPYGFCAIPQYETERLLEEHLAGLGTHIERNTELQSFTQDPDGVTARLTTPGGGTEELRVRYLIGCDGAHSTVRKQLGLSFEGGAFPDEYMLADVETDWDVPSGYAVRSSHRTEDGATDDLLVCVPLPGRGRYRMSMLVPPELSAPTDGAAVAHGLETTRRPDLHHIQAVVDRLAPTPATVSDLRWSSVFRISHRIVDRYADRRVFIAGDAAHIHPPTGGQGMNTGIQDACNIAWKLALVLRGDAGPALLAGYDTERRPIGEEVVGRTVRHAAHGIQADPDDPRTQMLREAQLLVTYRDSPLPGLQPGDRAPDCPGLTTPVATYPLRLLDLLRPHPGHVLVRWTDTPAGPPPAVGLPAVTVTSRPAAPGTYHDSTGAFARLYRPEGPTGFLVRPDTHLAARFPLPDTDAALTAYFRSLSGAA